jgi:ABC-2 type transport system ATP-binding protein
MKDNGSDTPLLELRAATRFYGTVIGSNDLNLVLPRGAYGLVGPNGAGKTTFIDLLTGALRPSMGSVLVFGKNPANHPTVLARMGICPAQDVLLPSVAALDWVRMLLQVNGRRRKDAEDRARQALVQVGLGEAMNRGMGSYSLGMRQRAKLAQAIAHDPELLILDEPFNGLDPIARHEISELLRDWSARGRSLILASHVLHEVEAVTDAFLLIYGGRLLAYGSSGELRNILTNLPQEVTIEGEGLDALAGEVMQIPAVEGVKLSAERRILRVFVREPLNLYSRLLEFATDDGEPPAQDSGNARQVRIRRVSGADGDLSALFKTLTSRHLGQVE